MAGAAGLMAAFSVAKEGHMALGISSNYNGGDIKPFIKYDAKAGRLFRVDRVQQNDGTYATDTVEITDTAQMAIDLANIRVGWINYTTQGPVRRLVVLGKEPIPPRPEDKNAEGHHSSRALKSIFCWTRQAAGVPFASSALRQAA